MTEFVHQPEGRIRLGGFLKSHLEANKWTAFSAAVAYAKTSGVRHIYNELAQYVQYGGKIKI
jgi:hypothetical protein